MKANNKPSLYRLTSEKFDPVFSTTFAAQGVLERKHLQSLLRKDISPLGHDLMVIAEEYGQWVDSNRRIDLLCLGDNGDIVVVEIKRTEDGGHMELQALRYASMVSKITLDDIIQAHAKSQSISEEEARGIILDFLHVDSLQEAALTGKVRIILASADFSKELTTAVLWLNDCGLNITCIRLRPYRVGNDILIDATQVIPIPEAEELVVKIRVQEQEKQKVLNARQETLHKFWAQLIARSQLKTPLLAGCTPSSLPWISSPLSRDGFFLNAKVNKYEGRVECYIKTLDGAAMNKSAYKALLECREEIEAVFGGALVWQELPERPASRICLRFPGGWFSPESEWPEIHDRIIDAMIRLEAAVRKPIQELKLP